MKNMINIAIALTLGALLVLASCGGKDVTASAAASAGVAMSTAIGSGLGAGVSSSDSKSYHPTWLSLLLNGDQLSLSLAETVKDKMVHFWVNLPSGKEAFMVYRLDGVDYIRADICVPCRSTSFSLEKGVLVCDTCGTRFDAKTGAGISGACKNYPKDEAKTSVLGDNLTVTTSALAAAYASTLLPG
jgi:hypothetical protein